MGDGAHGEDSEAQLAVSHASCTQLRQPPHPEELLLEQTWKCALFVQRVPHPSEAEFWFALNQYMFLWFVASLTAP